MATTYAPVHVAFHGQTFLAEIEDNTLYLVVRNLDGTTKRLGPSALIEKADKVKYEWAVQTQFKATLEGGETITMFDRKKMKAYSKEEELQKLKVAVATRLLDQPVLNLFPKNIHKQYAE